MEKMGGWVASNGYLAAYAGLFRMRSEGSQVRVAVQNPDHPYIPRVENGLMGVHIAPATCPLMTIGSGGSRFVVATHRMLQV